MCEKQMFQKKKFGEKEFIPLPIWPEITLAQNKLTVEKKFLQKFYFINMFTFTKFIFYKSSINYIYK